MAPRYLSGVNVHSKERKMDKFGGEHQTCRFI